jgi:dipeptidyl aminopeptidase/acylaminoacyl peptidase
MTPNNDLLDHAIELFGAPDRSFERLIRRRDRKERNRRVSAAVLAIVLTLLSITGLMRAFRNTERPATEPTPTPVDRGIFSHVGGWIAYADKGGTSGIWAVDPEAPGDPEDQILLSPGTGWPIAWSSDGSKLLILRLRRNTEYTAVSLPDKPTNLIVLNADGTETRLTNGDNWIFDGSFSPDGSKVVYATNNAYANVWFTAKPNDEPARIYVVDASGGTPQVLLTQAGEDLWLPTYSPDGSRIAYFEGMGGTIYSLRVMNADGSGTRIVRSDIQTHHSHLGSLVWSLDGTHLLFDGRAREGGGIYSAAADGSRLTLVDLGGKPRGRQTEWSPDLSRIAYTRTIAKNAGRRVAWGLVIADADGTHVQDFGYAASGPWNPLSEASSDIAPTTSLGATFDPRLLLGAVLLALGATFVVIRRRKRQVGEPDG